MVLTGGGGKDAMVVGVGQGDEGGKLGGASKLQFNGKPTCMTECTR